MLNYTIVILLNKGIQRKVGCFIDEKLVGIKD